MQTIGGTFGQKSKSCLFALVGLARPKQSAALVGLEKYQKLMVRVERKGYILYMLSDPPAVLAYKMPMLLPDIMPNLTIL